MAVVDAAEPAESEEEEAAAATTAEASAAATPAEETDVLAARGEAEAPGPTGAGEAMLDAPLTPRISPRAEQEPACQGEAQAEATDHGVPTA